MGCKFSFVKDSNKNDLPEPALQVRIKRNHDYNRKKRAVYGIAGTELEHADQLRIFNGGNVDIMRGWAPVTLPTISFFKLRKGVVLG